MHHHLSRLLRHRRFLLLPSTGSPASPAAPFSTAKRSSYARRTKAPAGAAEKAADDASASPEAEVGAGWQREKLPSELPRPSTIPFQPRVANAVRLVGTVGAPVQLQRLPDGRFSAVSVLVQDRRADFPKFWIPVIFQDDLAQVAASHLQENDLVSVSGQLTGDVPPFKHTDGQANIQVLAHLLSFVDSKAVETEVMVDEEEGFREIAEAEKKVEQTKVRPKFPAGTVSVMYVALRTRDGYLASYKNKQDKLNTLWNDVLTSPLDWSDNRAEKKKGSRSAKYPDFTNKISKEALWLDSAPMSVREKLDNVVFNSGDNASNTYKPVGNSMGKGTNTGWNKFKTSKGASPELKKPEADLWQNLVDNPQNWWDNRSDKLSSRHPDFKHKETGEALWIKPQMPSWVIDALPTMKAKAGSKGARRPETLLS